MIQYNMQQQEAVANSPIKFIFNLMKTQTNLEIATAFLELIVKTRLQFTQEDQLALRKQFSMASPIAETQQLLKFLGNFQGNSAYNIKQKLRPLTKRTNYNIRLLFKLLEKRDGKQVGFQSWNVMFEKITPESTQTKESQDYCDLFNSMIEMGQQLPLFQNYLNRDDSQFKKKRYFLDYKIQYSSDKQETLGHSVCRTQFKCNFFKIKSMVTYTSIEVQKEIPFFKNRMLKVLSQKKESDKWLKKLSTDESERSFDSKRSLKKKSFFQYYDSELDVTFLSNDDSDFKENGSLATKVIYQDDNPSSSQYEMIVNEHDEKFQVFREELQKLKEKVFGGQEQKQYFI